MILLVAAILAVYFLLYLALSLAIFAGEGD